MHMRASKGGPRDAASSPMWSSAETVPWGFALQPCVGQSGTMPSEMRFRETC